MDFKYEVIIKYPKENLLPESVDYGRDLCYDPIGTHTIELRNYYFRLKEQYAKKEQEKLDQTKHKRAKLDQTKLKTLKRNRKEESEKQDFDFSIPAFPKYYPFSDTLKAGSKNKCRTILKFRGQIPKCEIKSKRIFFINRILAQTGFQVQDCDNVEVECLSDLLDEFLQKFVSCLKDNKNSPPFSEDDDEWSPLETSLRNIGIGGVNAVHTFYYENFAKKHDILLNKCMELYKQYQNLCNAKT